jgi:hypothetical protein
MKAKLVLPALVLVSQGAVAQTRPASSTGRLPDGAVRLQPSRILPAPAPANNATIKVPLSVEGTAPERTADALRVTSGSGKITRAPAGESVLELPASGNVVLSSEPARAGAAKSRVNEQEKTPLPWLILEASRSAAGARALRAARPFLKLARAILWNASLRRHEAEFLFGLDPESGDAGPLEHPVAARFAVSCDEVNPAEATLSKVGPAGYATVHVGCSPAVKNERDEQQIEILLDRGDLSYPFTIPHRPGAPILESDHQEVPGFGFGASELTVSSVEEDGSPLLASDALPVRFSVASGGLSLDPLTIAKGQQRASVRIHPGGLEPVKVKAVLREMTSDEVTVGLTLPLLPITAMLLGGSIGGATALAWTSWKNDWRKALARVGKGAVIGLLVAALALILPTVTGLPSWAPRTELGLFLVSAFAGFIGTPVLRGFASLVFPSLRRGKTNDVAAAQQGSH